MVLFDDKSLFVASGIRVGKTTITTIELVKKI